MGAKASNAKSKTARKPASATPKKVAASTGAKTATKVGAAKSARTASKPAKQAKQASAPPAARLSWAETMKRALENKQPPGGFPQQPKPRDSSLQPVKKNAF